MNVIKVKAKVCQLSEEDMEATLTYDLGEIASAKHWSWKNVGIEVPSIYKLEEFDERKCIIITYDDEIILVKEKFESLFSRWQELKKDQVDTRKRNEEEAVENDDDDFENDED